MSAPEESLAAEPGSEPLADKRHERFAQLCVVHTRSDAARRVGYKGSRVRDTAYKLSIRPEIAARIDWLKAQALKDAGVDAHAVLRELALVARSNIAHYQVDDEGFVTLGETAPRDAMRAIARVKRKRREIYDGHELSGVEYETEIHLWDKNTAITNALKHLGLLTDAVKHEVTGKDGAPIAHAHTVRVVFVKPESKSDDGDNG